MRFPVSDSNHWHKIEARVYGCQVASILLMVIRSFIRTRTRTTCIFSLVHLTFCNPFRCTSTLFRIPVLSSDSPVVFMRFSYIKNIVVFDSDAGTLYPSAWDPFNFMLPCSPVKVPLILYGSIIRVSTQRQVHTSQNYVILTPGVAFVLLQLRLLCATFVCFVWFASILFGLCLLRVPFALCD